MLLCLLYLLLGSLEEYMPVWEGLVVAGSGCLVVRVGYFLIQSSLQISSSLKIQMMKSWTNYKYLWHSINAIAAKPGVFTMGRRNINMYKLPVPECVRNQLYEGNRSTQGIHCTRGCFHNMSPGRVARNCGSRNSWSFQIISEQEYSHEKRVRNIVCTCLSTACLHTPPARRIARYERRARNFFCSGSSSLCVVSLLIPLSAFVSSTSRRWERSARCLRISSIHLLRSTIDLSKDLNSD